MADFTIVNASGASLGYTGSGSSFTPTTLASGDGFLQLGEDLWVQIQPDGTQMYYAHNPPPPPDSSSSSPTPPLSYLYVACDQSSGSSGIPEPGSSSSSGGGKPPTDCNPILGQIAGLLPKNYLAPYLGSPIDLAGNEVHAGQPNLWTAQADQPGTPAYAHDGFHTAMDRAMELTQRLAHGFNLLDRNSGNNCVRPQAKCQVNLSSGNLLLSVKLPSSGPVDPQIELFYNSQSVVQPSAVTYFGFGWSGLFSQQIVASGSSGPRYLFFIQRANSLTGEVSYGPRYSWYVYRSTSSSPVAWVKELVTNRMTQFSYTSEFISQIEDPNGRITGFTVFGENLTEVTFPDGTGIQLEYTGHLLTTWTNYPQTEEATQFAYDACGRVTSITTPQGETTTFDYISDTQRVMTDAAGNVTTFTLDSYLQNVQVVEQPDGIVTTYVWDALQRLDAIVDPNGNTTTFAYSGLYADGSYRLSEITQPSGTFQIVNQFNSSLFAAQVQAIVDQNGNASSFTWDADNNRTVFQDATGQNWNYAYDDNGKMIQLQDPLGNVTSWVYDSQGRRTAVIDALGNITTYAYNAYGQVRQVANPLNQLTTYVYDTMNRLRSTQDAIGNITTHTYDYDGRQILLTNALSNSWQTVYDNDGRSVQEIDPDGDVTSYTYDAVFNRTTVTSPRGYVTSYTYDAVYRNVETIDPLNHITTHVYDDAGNEIETVNPLSEITTSTFDASNRRIASTDPLSHTTTYAYDGVGNVIATTDPLNETATQIFDPVIRQIATIDPLGHITTSAYDAANRKIAVTNAELETTSMAYDPVGRQIATIDPLGHISSERYLNPTYRQDGSRL